MIRQYPQRLLRRPISCQQQQQSLLLLNRCSYNCCNSNSNSSSNNIQNVVVRVRNEQQKQIRHFSHRLLSTTANQQQQQQQQHYHRNDNRFLQHSYRYYYSNSNIVNSNRNSSTATTTINNSNDQLVIKEEEIINDVLVNTKKEKLRVAIIGNGCAGLCTALQLSELVEMGYIDGPIDVYCYPNDDNDNDNEEEKKKKSSSKKKSKSMVGVGVGIWSTAFDTYKNSNRQSYQYFYNQLTQHYGTYSTNVGYRIPNGTWILNSTLPDPTTTTTTNSTTSTATTTTTTSIDTNNNNTQQQQQQQQQQQLPSLLFTRECDFIQLFKETIDKYESKYIQFHTSTIPIEQLNEDNDDTAAAAAVVVEPYSTNLVYSDGITKTDRTYHLIIAADGTYSKLRQRYGGYDIVATDTSFVMNNNNSTSTAAVADDKLRVTLSLQNQLSTRIKLNQQRNGIVSVLERNYIVFRGISPLSNEQMKQYDKIISFQTWGENYNMRFATVPMKINNIEHQVWFVTIDNTIVDDELLSNNNTNKYNNTDKDSYNDDNNNNRIRDWLVSKFDTWHDPIKLLISSTPSTDIYMDRAVAHTHNVPPVLNFKETMRYRNHLLLKNNSNSNNNNNNNNTTSSTSTASTSTSSTSSTTITNGTGPCILFHGDAYMTIDPILAQGFTCAMEGSYSIKQTLKHVIEQSSSSIVGQQQQQQQQYYYDPYILQQLLYKRHIERIDRLKCVIEISELVQYIGQPTHSYITTVDWVHVSGFINVHIIRPIVINLVPNFIKQYIFNTILQYSLGLGNFHSKKKNK